METQTFQAITSAIAPIVMVSAAGLLYTGVQSKNLHLADRVRALMTEYRNLAPESAHRQRRDEIVEQVALFKKRISLSQRALEFIYLAIVTFVVTSLLLAATPWIGGEVTPSLTGGVFIVGVVLLLVAVVMEYRELRLGLQTVDIEIGGVVRGQ